MSKLKNTDSTATAAELGRILDLSEASIHAYARRGVIVRASRGRYRREESIRRYVRELRAQLETAQGGSDSATLLRTEKIRVAQEQANKLALANARERGELFDADAVEREWSDMLRMLSSGLLTISAQCGLKLPHLTQRDVLVIDGEIRDKLAELGGSNGHAR
jgi:phage terminase Nu1 subunit (DNA packaging protein)